MRQRAASRRNIRKAQAAFRRKYGCRNGKTTRGHCRKAHRTARQIAAAKRNIKRAQAKNRRTGRYGRGRRHRGGSKRRGGGRRSRAGRPMTLRQLAAAVARDQRRTEAVRYV
jgi:hypothetical protein